MPPLLIWPTISVRGRIRADHRLGLIVGAGRRGEQQRAIGHRRFNGVEQFGTFQNMVGAGGRALGGDVRPAVARVDDAKPRQREIPHGARGHADVLAKLRLDQNDDGAWEVEGCFGLVGA